ncbi:UNVERIFIED_CONTAM: Acidic endochitinase [Sesamum radiatum]|uniref:Acidic endochitinase n=1 Tax=Sesamum radiatum TaxID=300843 RepID=A0AAW2NDN6_SESRA
MAAAYSQSSTKPLLIILSILIAFSLFNFRSSKACERSTYWGHKTSEGSLQELCETGAVKYVNLAFLTQFGCGQTPVLNFTGHCDPSSGTCRSLSTEIRACQSWGIKVQLSLGGIGNRTLCSPDDVSEVAEYLWHTYLAPGSTGPLGDAPLDGIDFGAVSPSLYWDDLVRALASLNSSHKKVYLSAVATCSYPDPVLGKAIDTGLFDYIWQKSYQNPQCDCDTGVSCVLASWFKWSCSLPAGKPLFFSQAPRQSCFLSQIFTAITYSPNYAGFVLPGGVYNLRDIKIIYQELCSHESLHSEGSLASVHGLNNMVA